MIEVLEGTEVELFDETKAEITINNPENDWSGKEKDLAGGAE